MPSLRNVKEVQILTRRVAALIKFISKSSDKCHKFFNILKRNKDFKWTDECDEAFQALKKYLGSSPLLSNRKKERFFSYI